METNTTPQMPQFHIEGIMNHATQFIDMMKTGKGFGVDMTPEQKAEFDKMLANNGGEKMLKDLQEKMDSVKKTYEDRMSGHVPKV